MAEWYDHIQNDEDTILSYKGEILKDLIDAWRSGNVEHAIRICEDRASKGEAEFQKILGWIYYSKESKNHDLEKALHHFEEAAKAGQAEAVFGIGCVYHSKKDYSRAFHYYSDSHRLGCKRSLYWIGAMYDTGLGVEKDTEQALRFYKRGMDEGYVLASKAYLRAVLRRKSSTISVVKALFKYVLLIVNTFRLARKNIGSEFLADVITENSKKVPW